VRLGVQEEPVWTAHNRGLEVADKSAARQAYVEKYVAFASVVVFDVRLHPHSSSLFRFIFCVA
jgi:hypothetical protein